MKDIPHRAARVAKVAASAARVGAGVAVSRVKNAGRADRSREAALLRAALGGLKGPLMKVGQLLAAIPDFLPSEYAASLASLQADAPAMGWPFVRRRMAGELGPDWQNRFESFEREASFAASLGQVHRAKGTDGRLLACKLQYPEMSATIEADLAQLRVLLGLFDKISGAVKSAQAYQEIADRLREEADYEREARTMRLYGRILNGIEGVHVPKPVAELSTSRLLTMDWMEGERLIEAAAHKTQEQRNALALRMFRVWYAPFYGYGLLHGDPHAGNYTLGREDTINLLDFGCVRVFEPKIVEAVLLLFKAILEENKEMACEAYKLWGFEDLDSELIETLNLWARFIYAPVLRDEIYDLSATNSTAQGRKIASEIYQRFAKTGQGIAIPRPFVMMDRASIGLGALFLRLDAKVNWHQLFCELTQDFSRTRLQERQSELLGELLTQA